MTDGVVVTHAGREVLFHPDTVRGASIGSFLRRGEFYEAGMLEYIRRLGLTGPYVDAGSAIGTHTLFFAKVCDAEQVYAFEPHGYRPTGHYFNSTPTFEFRRPQLFGARAALVTAAAAYQDVPAQPRPKFLPDAAAGAGAPRGVRGRLVRTIDERTPALGRALRTIRDRVRGAGSGR